MARAESQEQTKGSSELGTVGQEPNPPEAGPCGRLAIQSPLADYEPNLTVEISSTEATPVNPASRRTSFAQQRIPVRTSLLSGCLRKWMMDNASDSWLHRCSHRREKQVGSLQKIVTLVEREFCILLSKFKHCETSRFTLTQTEAEQRHEKFTAQTTRKWKDSSRTYRSERILETPS